MNDDPRKSCNQKLIEERNAALIMFAVMLDSLHCPTRRGRVRRARTEMRKAIEFAGLLDAGKRVEQLLQGGTSSVVERHRAELKLIAGGRK